MGYPVEIHFGALKEGEDLYGHSWVTMDGEPLADTARSEVFKVVYSYPIAGSPPRERDTTSNLTKHKQKEAKMKKKTNRPAAHESRSMFLSAPRAKRNGRSQS